MFGVVVLFAILLPFAIGGHAWAQLLLKMVLLGIAAWFVPALLGGAIGLALFEKYASQRDRDEEGVTDFRKAHYVHHLSYQFSGSVGVIASVVYSLLGIWRGWWPY